MEKFFIFLMALAVLATASVVQASENKDHTLRKDIWTLGYESNLTYDFSVSEDNIWAFDKTNGLTLELFGSREKKGAINFFIKPDTSHKDAYGPYGPEEELNAITPAAGIQLIFDLTL